MTDSIETWLTMKYPEATLRKAFDFVQDKSNWKNPIRKRVRSEDFAVLGITEPWQDVVREAIGFYAGSHTLITFNAQNYTYLVEAEGYYKSIGA